MTWQMQLEVINWLGEWGSCTCPQSTWWQLRWKMNEYGTNYAAEHQRSQQWRLTTVEQEIAVCLIWHLRHVLCSGMVTMKWKHISGCSAWQAVYSLTSATSCCGLWMFCMAGSIFTDQCNLLLWWVTQLKWLCLWNAISIKLITIIQNDVNI